MKKTGKIITAGLGSYALISWGLRLREKNKRKRLNAARQAEEICASRYPIVLVHGIFFRDWKNLNYWGRIPEELELNGAKIYYGEQDSTLPIAASAEQLKTRLLAILEESGAEKVNLIGHSKGGLDSRYMISRLGMADKVASLTTVNTPHFGSVLADELLAKMPTDLVKNFAGLYEKMLINLGDKQNDLIAALRDLTSASMVEFNEVVPDSEQVFYQSIGSKMAGAGSAALPFNLGYAIIKPIAGDNDGLVQLSSMTWGNYLGTVESRGRSGVSHGDMVDMYRRKLRDFQVQEYYVQLVADLKKRGF